MPRRPDVICRRGKSRNYRFTEQADCFKKIPLVFFDHNKLAGLKFIVNGHVQFPQFGFDPFSSRQFSPEERQPKVAIRKNVKQIS